MIIYETFINHSPTFLGIFQPRHFSCTPNLHLHLPTCCFHLDTLQLSESNLCKIKHLMFLSNLDGSVSLTLHNQSIGTPEFNMHPKPDHLSPPCPSSHIVSLESRLNCFLTGLQAYTLTSSTLNTRDHGFFSS